MIQRYLLPLLKYSFSPWYLLLLALGCSAALTYLTVTPPLVPGDWSRLNLHRIYIPPQIRYDWTPYSTQVGLWMLMIGLLIGVVYQTRTPLPSQTAANRIREPLLVLIFSLAGFGLRLHTWNSLPLIMDEIGFAAHASDILHGQHVPLLAPGHNANPSLYSAMIAFSMALFGQNLFAIRIVPVIFGTLTIPAMYTFGKTWWSPRIGLIGAALLTVFPAHVFFSRISVYNGAEPFFSLLALTWLHRAVQKRDSLSFTFTAIFAALDQYLYHGSRLTLILIGLYLLRNYQKSLIKPILWIMLVLFLLLLPWLGSMAVHDLPLSGNWNTLRLPDQFASNSLRAWLAWVGQQDKSPFWLSDAALLPGFMSLLFLGGCVWSLQQWRDARSTLLLASPILTTIFGGVLLSAAPLYIRYMTALPCVIMLVSHAIGRLPKSLQAVALIIICAQNIMLIRQHPQEAFDRITLSQWQEADLAEQAAALPPDAAVRLILPPDFDRVQKITVADYLAVYGQRRIVRLTPDIPAPVIELTPSGFIP